MKPHKDPEGYKKLLAYKKAAEVQEFNLNLTDLFPPSFAWLKEQMDKSGRSGTKNIIEGWKRNTTAEYYTFLGYSIGALEELKDDSFDIAKGLYKPLLGIAGLWKGSKGNKGGNGNEAKGNNPDAAIGTGGNNGGNGNGGAAEEPEGNGNEAKGNNGGKGSKAMDPITPFPPFTPIQLEQLRFYPMDTSLPPIIQLYLRSKETLMLLHKLQQSLEDKMQKEGTMTARDKLNLRLRQDAEAELWLRKEIERIKREQREEGE